MSFKEKSTTQKGEYLEDLVRDWLIGRGFMPYQPTGNGAHQIDFFVLHNDGRRFCIDAKAKAKRRMFDDTGIDYRHYINYRKVEKSFSVDAWVFFGDHIEGWVYGATLDELMAPVMNPPGCKPGQYPRKEGSILYFPRVSMSKLFKLTGDQCVELKSATERNSRQLSLV